jgi:hypothetical protein
MNEGKHRQAASGPAVSRVASSKDEKVVEVEK